jgi:hypothetical protein
MTGGDAVREGAGARPASEGELPGRRIAHVAIPVLDRRLAARFYGALFEWEYEHMDEPVNYTFFSTGTVPGGFADANDLNPLGQTTLYVESEDIEADLDRAERLGGRKLTTPTEVPGYGRVALFIDPSGNRVGLFCATPPA